uniref:Peptidase C1A papain C-terminal domain-containing protein n=1 Tax=Globisporangium ultimum (strain ATCC 200006 / CBS 805.95 / DAOM BR144) TaxID=431595 RepID=K3WA09_GLOUD
MKVSALASFVAAAAIAAAHAHAAAPSPLEYEREFATWLETHGLVFEDPLMYIQKMETYIANDQFIRHHNEHSNTSFTLGHNEFSHLTFQEFAAMKRGFAMPEGYLETRLKQASTMNSTSVDVDAAPVSVDWVEKGGVTAVKNQGQCGSCWAFSTTGAVEGAAFVSGKKLPTLSEQELVDCDHNGDHGCNGGLMDHALQWIQEQGGICSEEAYNYHGAVEQCHKCKQVVQVTGFTDVTSNDETALKIAVSKQPVSVAIEADQREFQFYKSGVFDKPCGQQLDHGVLAVGYGVEDDKKFWKIKNSWGTTWGENGYIRLARDFGPAAGQCGIAMAPSYPHAAWISGADEVQQQEEAITEELVVTEAEMESLLTESLELALENMIFELGAMTENNDIDNGIDLQLENVLDGEHHVYEYIPSV